MFHMYTANKASIEILDSLESEININVYILDAILSSYILKFSSKMNHGLQSKIACTKT